MARELQRGGGVAISLALEQLEHWYAVRNHIEPADDEQAGDLLCTEAKLLFAAGEFNYAMEAAREADASYRKSQSQHGDDPEHLTAKLGEVAAIHARAEVHLAPMVPFLEGTVQLRPVEPTVGIRSQIPGWQPVAFRIAGTFPVSAELASVVAKLSPEDALVLLQTIGEPALGAVVPDFQWPARYVQVRTASLSGGRFMLLQLLRQRAGLASSRGQVLGSLEEEGES